MSRKTIAKFSTFVIAFALLSLTFSGCGESFKGKGPADIGEDGRSDDYLKGKGVGTIESEKINESSGIAASRCRIGVLWTHNDSGGEPEIYAIDEKGKTLGSWRVSGASNTDWEDIAAAPDCRVYIGEIGNNELRRTKFRIYSIAEPNISADGDANGGGETEPATVIEFSYPDGPHDAETLMVHPKSGDIYVLTKSRRDASGVYKVPRSGGVAVKIADVSVPAIPDGLLTGGDISPDGRRVVVCDYFAAYEFKLPESAKNFDEIWKAKPLMIELPDRKVGESIGYSADGLSIYATSEKLKSPVIRVDRKKPS